MINAIELKTTAQGSYFDDFGNALAFLPNIKHINVFIGENNSGKSRLMRALVNSKDALLLIDDIKPAVENEVVNIRRNLKNAINKFSEKYPEIAVHNKHDEMSAPELYVYYKKYAQGMKLSEKKLEYPNQNAPQDIQNALSRLYQIVTSQTVNNSVQTIASVTKVYIPVLRGIENFNIYFDTKRNDVLDSLNMNLNQRNALNEYKSNAQRIYKNKTASVYKIDQKYIFTGENLYEEIRDKLLGEEADRLLIRDFEQFISKNFYDGEGFNIIPLINQGYLNVKIGNNKERPLHDLGDGIKQLICILYKIFEQRGKEALFFIEEPEINLHPGYQRKLIDILQQNEFSNLCFFFFFHSNHFVDSCFDYNNISLFKFINVNKKDSQFQVVDTSPSDIELLNLLGVNNSSVFMANATIWVEGISDKIYLSKYLQTYMKEKGGYEFKEGVDYSFVEYGGNNITHWAFEGDDDIATINASGITNRAMIILDNDNDSVSKSKRKEQLKLVFGDRYYELKVREIENTIKPEVIISHLFSNGEIAFKGNAEKKRDRFDTKSAYLWEYIDSHYELPKKYWNKQKKAPTVSKMKFAKDVVAHIERIDDLSEHALSLCESIYSFLVKTHEEINK